MKKAVGLLLMTFIVLSLWANEAIFQKMNINQTSLQRGPANEVFENAERKLASELSEVKSRTLASIGHSANPFDNFRFGILEGKYAVTMSGENIKDVSFVDNPDSVGSPKRVADRVEFLKSNAQILNIKSKIEKMAIDIKGRKIIETYKAFLKDNNKEVIVRIELDELDRVYNISLL